MKTEIRVSPKGYEVWYTTDGGKTRHFHKTFKSMDNAVRETVAMKGYQRLLIDLKK